MFKTSAECRLELVAATNLVWKGWEDPVGDASFLPVSAARASFGKEDKTGLDEAADLKLMKFLADNRHLTPFESLSATFLIECPLFVRSQIHRHRTFSYSEWSRRYTAERISFWIPDTWRKQSENNKQASSGELTEVDEINDMYFCSLNQAVYSYEDMLRRGVCREQARAVLPQSLITNFYMSGNLRNWHHFYSLRSDPHAQYEVRVVAEKIAAKLKELWPEAWGALCESS